MAVKCTATTSNGKACRRNAGQDSAFCALHAPASIINPPLVPDAINLALDMAEWDAAHPDIAYANRPSDWTPSRILMAQAAPIINQSINQEESTMTVKPNTTYQDETTPINVVIPRKDAPNPLLRDYKPNDRDQDVAYFNKLLNKKTHIRKLIMPEYFVCPADWTPTLKLKQGESLPERLIRDWESWRKSYARAFRAGKVRKVDGVFFHPAKISMGGFIALMRGGKRSYCLEYARDSQFGISEESFLAMVGVADMFPLVHSAITAATAYHMASKKKDGVQADIDSAHAAWVGAFNAACVALRAIDTSKLPDSDIAPVKAARKTVETVKA